jgi:hypothetical protein
LAEGNFNLGQVAECIWKYYPERAKSKGIPLSKLDCAVTVHRTYGIHVSDTPFSGYPPEGVYTADASASKNILGIEYIKFPDMLKDTLSQFILLEKELAGA